MPDAANAKKAAIRSRLSLTSAAKRPYPKIPRTMASRYATRISAERSQ